VVTQLISSNLSARCTNEHPECQLSYWICVAHAIAMIKGQLQ